MIRPVRATMGPVNDLGGRAASLITGISVALVIVAISIVPFEGVSSPAIRFMTVDLPQPDGPTTQTNSPVSIVRLTSLTAIVFWPAFGPGNDFVTCEKRSLGTVATDIVRPSRPEDASQACGTRDR